MIRKLSWLTLVGLVCGCTIFGKKDGDNANYEDPIDRELLHGQWLEVQRFDLLANMEVKFSEQEAAIVLLDDAHFSMLTGVLQQQTCVDRRSYEVQGRQLRIAGTERKTYEVKGVDGENLNLVELGQTGTPVYERLFRKVDASKLSGLFAAASLTNLCPAFAAFSSGNGATTDDGVFRPNIDINSDYASLSFNSEWKVSENNTSSNIGYVRFVMENGQAYKPGSQPAASLACEFNFLNLFQITKSDGQYIFSENLRYRVIKTSRNSLNDGRASLVVLMDGCELQCIAPNSDRGISDADLKRALGTAISVQ